LNISETEVIAKLQQPWSTPEILHANINNELVETCSVASQLLVLDRVVVAKVQLEIKSDGAKLLPTPWLSFSSIDTIKLQ
jgi:hypothetical protein